MGAGETFAKATILTAIITLTVASAAAADITVNSDKSQWLNSGPAEISGNYQCSSPGWSINIVHEGSSQNTISEDQSTGNFSHTIDSGPGDYKAELTCDGNTISSDSVTAKRLELSFQNPDEQVRAYKGNSFEFVLENQVSGSSSNLNFNNQEFNFKSEIINYGSLDTYYEEENGNKVTLSAEVPEDIPTDSGVPRLRGMVDYEDFTVGTSGIKEVDVRPTWSFNVSDVNPGDQKVAYQKLGDLSLDLQVKEKGEEKTQLSSDDFYVTIQETGNGSIKTPYEKRNFLDASWNGNGYTLTLPQRPDLDLGRYNFKIGLDRKGGVEIMNFTVSKYILFSGEIKNAGGQPVDGKISVSKDGFSRVIEVKSDGSYSGQVLPGEYNFTLSFPKAKLSLKGVDLRSSESTVQDGRAVGDIRYDEIPVGEVGKNMQGVTVFNSLAVWFGYPFDSGRMSLSYDTTRVNPSNLKVYECVGWNIDGVSCYQGSEWQGVGIQDSWIHPTVGTVSFPVRSYEGTGSSILLNGYMVVKNTNMLLNSVEIGTDRVKTEGSVNVQGEVVTPAEDPINNAKVSVQVVRPGSGEVLSVKNVTTGQAGVFSTSISAPSEVGDWDIIVGGERKPYSGFSEEVSGAFSTFIQQSMSMEGPTSAQLVVGKESRSEFTIINDGQTPVKDVGIALSGFDRQWYSFTDNDWGTLQPGESVQTELVFDLPGDYCSESCQEYQTVTVEATGEAGGKVNSLVQIQAQIRQNAPGNVSSNTDNPSQSGSGLKVPDVGNMTGNFLKEQGSFNLALGMIMVFLLVLAAAVKKKKSGEDRSRPLSGMSGGGSGNSKSAAGSKPQRENIRKSKPDVSNSEGKEEDLEDVEEKNEDQSKEDQKKSSDEGGEQEESSEAEEEAEVFECGTCGEEFDTESARELHEKAIHE